jgi:16S rRNA (adenine1518-N6/adenine1519-N6)-dimethyltransferase
VTLYSSLASPRATIDQLTRWGLNTRKSLGQHFLVDDGVLGRILRLSSLREHEVVLEVGPGIGTLSEALLRTGVSVLAVEKDRRLLPVLADMKTRYPASFHLICADALDLPLLTLPVPVDRLIANLPYAVAATVVLDCFVHLPSLLSATVMVQKEVAARMAARPGSKDYGAYTVKLGLLARAGEHFAVSRSSFLPPPQVDSTVIRLDRHPVSPPPSAASLAEAFFIIEAAFAERRKIIRNSMRSYFAAHDREPAQADDLLAAAAIPPTTRGEMLTFEDFRRLVRLPTDSEQPRLPY